MNFQPSTFTAKIIREDIQGLRAVAVIGVIAFHFGLTQLGGGYAGVDVFFVISGFLITTQLRSQLADNGTINLLSFYAGRLRRLLPSVLLVVLSTLLAGYFIYSPAEQALYSSDAFYTSAYVLNLKLLKNAFDYFAPEANSNPFLHFWSLAVEEQFYLLWPLLLLLRHRFLDSVSLKVLLATVIVLSFAGCVAMTYVSQPWAFYALPFRAWEFAVGGSIPLLTQIQNVRVKKAIGYAGLSLIFVAYLTLSEHSAFPGWIATLPVIGTASVIYAGMDPRSSTALLSAKPLQLAGSLSYPLYLWHWPVIVYASALATELGVLERIALVGLTIVLSIVSKSLVEDPIRFNRHLGKKPAFAFAMAICFTAGGLSAAVLAKHFATSSISARQKLISDESMQNTAARKLDTRCLSQLLVEVPFPCTLGDPSSTKTIVLFGDSHADMWSTALDIAARELGLRLVTVMKSSCTFADLVTNSTRLHRRFVECERWREAAIRKIDAINPDLVVLAHFTASYVKNSLIDETSAPADQYVSAVRRTIDHFGSKGIHTAILKDAPFMGRSVPTCLARADWTGRPLDSCDVARRKALDPTIDDIDAEAISGRNRTRLIDLSSAFCNDEVCRAAHQGLPMFRDSHHVSDAYATVLAPHFAEAIAEAKASRTN